MVRTYHPTDDVVYKDITTGSDICLVCFSGLGKTIRAQHEGFMRRFALLNGVSYLAFDFDKMTRNSNESAGYNFKRIEEQVRRKLAALKEKRLFFQGTCFGALMAYHFASKLPQGVKGLVLTAPAIDSVEEGLEQHFRQALKPHHLTNSFLPLLIYANKHYGKINNATTYQGPITILHGDRDRLIPVENSKKLVSSLNRPNIQLQVIPNAGHGTANGKEMKLSIVALKKQMEREK